ASFDAIGISWLPSPFTTAPMENSPPGIQTIPAGALPGGEFLFAIVGSNCAVPQNAEPRVKTATTANHTMDFMNTFGCFTVGVLTLFFNFAFDSCPRKTRVSNRPLMITGG